MCVRLTEALVIFFIPSLVILFLILFAALFNLLVFFCHDSIILGLIYFSVRFYSPEFFLAVARYIFCMHFRGQVA